MICGVGSEVTHLKADNVLVDSIRLTHQTARGFNFFIDGTFEVIASEEESFLVPLSLSLE